MMSKETAREFASGWLPAWTGNNPEKLAAFYSDDCFYLDPGIPDGINGKKELLSYFRKLLSQNPNWIWSQLEAIPMQGGFLNKWLAEIPVGDEVIRCIGVCLVQFNAQHEICRNEVYFDRTDLTAAIRKFKNFKNN